MMHKIQISNAFTISSYVFEMTRILLQYSEIQRLPTAVTVGEDTTSINMHIHSKTIL